MIAATFLPLLAIYGASASPVPQGPNTAATNHPTLRTQSSNGTWGVIPLNFDVVQSLVAPKKLIPIKSDSSKYPNGWPAGTHPVLISGTYNAYIEQLGLEIPNYLMAGAVRVPCVDQLNDGKTCFNYALADYIGGANGQVISSTVPALVGSLEGTTIHEGTFQPNGEALSDIGGGQSNFQVDDLILPNPVSGPSLAPSAFSFNLQKKVASSKLLTSKGFHDFISQPLIQNNGLCQNNPYYFNESFARPFFAEGTTTLFQYYGFNGLPSALSGTYSNATFYSANGENIGYNGQPCDQAAASADPAAQQ